MTIHTQTPARAARRQLFVDRATEYLTEKCGNEDRARAYARDLLGIADNLGFTLPPALDDPPPLRTQPAPDDSPGRREFAEAREALAARRAGRT